MTRKVPIKEPYDDGSGYFSKIWIKFFRSLKTITNSIVDNPTLPYDVESRNEIIFITTTTAGVVNLLPVEDGLRCRVVNMPASTANVLLTPNDTDLLYGYNTAEPIYPGEALDVDGSEENGWY